MPGLPELPIDVDVTVQQEDGNSDAYSRPRWNSNRGIVKDKPHPTLGDKPQSGASVRYREVP